MLEFRLKILKKNESRGIKMKNKRFSEDEIYSVLKEWESGLKVSELVRKHGVTEQTLYRWRSRYGGMEKSDM